MHRFRRANNADIGMPLAGRLIEGSNSGCGEWLLGQTLPKVYRGNQTIRPNGR
jgi:hypothetical protein